ncbi:hypothetical protein P154DRAFT_589997 [Amniculicola lignicola CBS 123094]|uniref:Uncharacterized protein n=1 Tax=Amniculicola lignicola CBS 123094 TaxID=1392246 RepID=A0A6A5WRU4_9PLEO|nr:hypothetical protein P154DRAFT_589997 [Amniculicola lignicola CBS 123094]
MPNLLPDAGEGGTHPLLYLPPSPIHHSNTNTHPCATLPIAHISTAIQSSHPSSLSVHHYVTTLNNLAPKKPHPAPRLPSLVLTLKRNIYDMSSFSPTTCRNYWADVDDIFKKVRRLPSACHFGVCGLHTRGHILVRSSAARFFAFGNETFPLWDVGVTYVLLDRGRGYVRTVVVIERLLILRTPEN